MFFYMHYTILCTVFRINYHYMYYPTIYCLYVLSDYLYQATIYCLKYYPSISSYSIAFKYNRTISTYSIAYVYYPNIST